MEIERKWLFDLDEIPKNLKPFAKYLYDQGYLSIHPEVRIRRKKTIDNHRCTYALCIKSKGLLERIEVEKDLTKDEFNQLMQVGNLKEEDLIHKYCMNYSVNDYILAVGTTDIGKPTKFCYGEIEFTSVEEANAFIPPAWFGKEVTNDSSYKMANYWARTRS